MTQADEKNTKTPQKPWKMEHDVTWQHYRRVLTHHWGVVLTRHIHAWLKKSKRVNASMIITCDVQLQTMLVRFVLSRICRYCLFLFCSSMFFVCCFTRFTSPSKVPSACFWLCSMSLFTSFTSPFKSLQSPYCSVCFRFCRDFLLVFDFVAWMCLQVLQAPSKVPSACLSFCSYKPLPGSQVSAFWFCRLFLICSLQNQTG